MSPHGDHSGPDRPPHLHPQLDLPYDLPDWAFRDRQHPSPGVLESADSGPGRPGAGAVSDRTGAASDKTGSADDKTGSGDDKTEPEDNQTEPGDNKAVPGHDKAETGQDRTEPGRHNTEPPDDNDNLGLPTFGQRDWVGTAAGLAARRPDVAIVGAPFDINTTNRAGARFGPKYVRSTAYDPGTYHLDLGIELYDWLDVVDNGDAYCPHGQTGPSLRNIERKVAGVLAAGAFPIVIGGDHSITWPAATAVARKYGWGTLGLLHFDAHADTADIIEGNLASHGTPMRRLIESGAVRGSNFVQIGLRGYWPPPEIFDWMQEQQMTWHLMHEIWERGVRPVIADAIARASTGCDALYLSVDIDVLDPGFPPGTGTPEPGGMNPADLLRAVRSIALETPLVAMDVVEVSPPYDHADNTVNNAHRVMLEALAGLAHKKRERAGGVVTRPGYRPDPASLRYPANQQNPGQR